MAGRRTAGETIEPETGRETVGPRAAEEAVAQDFPTEEEEVDEYFTEEALDGEEGEERGRTSLAFPRSIVGSGVGWSTLSAAGVMVAAMPFMTFIFGRG